MDKHIEEPHFSGRSVPIEELAKATGKDKQFLRLGLQKGIFKFGWAFKQENSTKFNYFCPDKLVYEQLGYFREADIQEKINLS